MTTEKTILYGLGGAALLIAAIAAIRASRDPRRGSNRAAALPAGPPPKPTQYIPAPGDDWSFVAHRLNIPPSRAMLLKSAITSGQAIALPAGYIDHGPEKKAMGKLA